jgi:hypothetical protein
MPIETFDEDGTSNVCTCNLCVRDLELAQQQAAGVAGSSDQWIPYRETPPPSTLLVTCPRCYQQRPASSPALNCPVVITTGGTRTPEAAETYRAYNAGIIEAPRRCGSSVCQSCCDSSHPICQGGRQMRGGRLGHHYARSVSEFCRTCSADGISVCQQCDTNHFSCVTCHGRYDVALISPCRCENCHYGQRICAACCDGTECSTLCDTCQHCTRICAQDRYCDCRRAYIRFTDVPSQPYFHPLLAGRSRRNPSKRYIAAEIEVAGVKGVGQAVSTTVQRWHGAVVGDGSLPDGGAEICTAPSAGDVWLAQIKDVCDALRTQQAFVTDACGLHVHVDARDFTFLDIRRMIILWGAVEDTMFRLVPFARRASHYCKPNAQMYFPALLGGKTIRDAKYLALRALYGGVSNGRARSRAKYDNSRYQAMNLHSWRYRGTIEFRLHSGTVDRLKIQAWGVLLASLVDYAYRTPESKLLAAIDAAPHGMALIQSIVPKWVAQWAIARWGKLNLRKNAVTIDGIARSPIPFTDAVMHKYSEYLTSHLRRTGAIPPVVPPDDYEVREIMSSLGRRPRRRRNTPQVYFYRTTNTWGEYFYRFSDGRRQSTYLPDDISSANERSAEEVERMLTGVAPVSSSRRPAGRISSARI